MTRSLARFTLLLVVAIAPSPAQTAPPAPPTPAQPSAPVQTIKTNAQLVVVDVVVTDSAGKPIHGLKSSDFTLKESGSPQVIRNFEEHSAATLADATRFAPMPQLPAGIFTNYSPAPANGAVNILLLDALNTPITDQAYVHHQLLAYLKSTPPGTRIAIFGLTTHLILLQSFTSDPEILKSFLAKTSSKGSPLLNDQVGGSGIQNSLADNLEDSLQNSGGNDAPMAALIAGMREFDATNQSFQLQLRARYTLDAMNDLARYLANIPGRKNLIWFSGSFPLDIMPDPTLENPFEVMASAGDEFRDTVGMLARAQVAVYPVDARGLINSPALQASTGRNYGGPSGTQRMVQDQTKFFTDTAAEHSTMLQMAAATGGRAFLNTNGLTQAVATAIDEGSNFYTLTYTPTNPQRDGKFRKINIQLSPGGYKLAYRQGYYADDPDHLKTSGAVDQAVSAANAPTARDTLRAAMTRGTPDPTEILIKVGVVPITPADKSEDQPAPGNTLAAKTHGPYRRYSVNYQIDPTDLTFLRTPDGKIHADLDLVIFAFDPDGAIVNSQTSTLHLTATYDQLKQLFDQGIFRHEEISTPAKGEYFLRIAVHDLHRDRFGAVEVATSAVKNVVPRTQPPPPASK